MNEMGNKDLKIEEKIFQDRGKSDYNRYLREEFEYHNTIP